METTAGPSMESVIEDYTAMRTEMLAAVDEAVGPREWAVLPTNADLSRRGCRDGEDDDGERASLPSWFSKGSLVDADRDAVKEAVWSVGREHGFDDTGTIVDRPDDLQLYGQDEHGGRYVFGSATNTVLGISTGCHRWDTPPEAAPAPTGIPDHAQQDED